MDDIAKLNELKMIFSSKDPILIEQMFYENECDFDKTLNDLLENKKPENLNKNKKTKRKKNVNPK